MQFNYFSHNGEILPIEEATVPLSSIEYSYGFGVYETIRVTNKNPRFLNEHLERLETSAKTIDLTHTFDQEFIRSAIQALLKKNEVDTCNLKILLIGGKSPTDAMLYILCLNPLFPDKKLYKEGVHCITYEYERLFPHAKTLNMLGSYLAYRKASEEKAYDALLVNRSHCVTEGTRTNLFFVQDKTLISPPEEDILLGVTRAHVLDVARAHGYEVEEREVRLGEVADFDGSFLTSTSTGIMPIRSIGDKTLPVDSPALRNLMALYTDFLKRQESTGV